VYPSISALPGNPSTPSIPTAAPKTRDIFKSSTIQSALFQLPYNRSIHQTFQKMSAFKVGDSFPEGVVFSYVPYTPETGDITACGIPINYDASKGTSSLALPSPPTPI
jgi:hypothetical protein